MGEKYWTVTMKVYAFETLEDAKAYQDAFIDAFCAMPESKGYGSGCTITEENDDAAPPPKPQETL